MSRAAVPVVEVSTLPFAEDGRVYRIEAKYGRASARLDVTRDQLAALAALTAEIRGDQPRNGFTTFVRCKRAVLTALAAMGTDGFVLKEKRKP